MKIKLQPHNKLQPQSSSTSLPSSKQHPLKKSKSTLTDSQRAFGDDITQKHKNINTNINTHYNHLLNYNHRNDIVLPSYLKQKECVLSSLRPYQEEIIEYLVNEHVEYDLGKKMKKNVCKSNKRVKVLEYFNNMGRKHRLKKKTVFLSTYYFDKYTEMKGSMSTDKLALTAEACLLIAMKYEEIYPPYLKDWSSKPKEVIKTQALILKALDFQLSFTSAQHYLQLYVSKRPQEPKEQASLYQCILDLYLITGQVYQDHPLKIVQQITDSFRNTAFMENNTSNMENDLKIKNMIVSHEAIWQNILVNNEPIKKNSKRA